MELTVTDLHSDSLSVIEVDDSVWNAPQNDALLHQSVVAQLANKRQGTRNTLTRSNVQGTKHKIRQQKGTGRSRQGDGKAPHFIGGGVAHGPHPREFRQRLPKKMRRQALRVALSSKVRSNRLQVIQNLTMPAPSTKQIVSLIDQLELKGSILLVTAKSEFSVHRSALNVPSINTLPVRQLNPLCVTKAANVVVTSEAVSIVDELWGSGINQQLADAKDRYDSSVQKQKEETSDPESTTEQTAKKEQTQTEDNLEKSTFLSDDEDIAAQPLKGNSDEQ